MSMQKRTSCLFILKQALIVVKWALCLGAISFSVGCRVQSLYGTRGDEGSRVWWQQISLSSPSNRFEHNLHMRLKSLAPELDTQMYPRAPTQLLEDKTGAQYLLTLRTLDVSRDILSSREDVTTRTQHLLYVHILLEPTGFNTIHVPPLNTRIQRIVQLRNNEQPMSAYTSLETLIEIAASQMALEIERLIDQHFLVNQGVAQPHAIPIKLNP